MRFKKWSDITLWCIIEVNFYPLSVKPSVIRAEIVVVKAVVMFAIKVLCLVLACLYKAGGRFCHTHMFLYMWPSLPMTGIGNNRCASSLSSNRVWPPATNNTHPRPDSHGPGGVRSISPILYFISHAFEPEPDGLVLSRWYGIFFMIEVRRTSVASL